MSPDTAPSPIDRLAPGELVDLGRRLQEARSRKGLTQQDAAAALGVARTTVTAIEKGERRVRPGELIKLAALYEVPVGDLVRTHPGARDFAIQFRTLLRREDHPDHELEQAAYDFQRLCEDYLELERICRAPLRRSEPAEYDVLTGGDHGIPPEDAAEELATAERKRLGLGDGPIPNLRQLLENEVGMRIFLMSLDSKLAAMFAYSVELGGCIAVNQNHPPERRRLSMAHEYAHFLTNRSHPEFTVLGRYQRLPASERLANAFALAFLLPETGVRDRFRAIQRSRGRAGDITPADLCTLADYYDISLEALTLRLEDLDLLPPGTWERLKATGFRVREAQALLNLSGPRQESADALPTRYERLAVAAYRRGDLSQGRLAKILRTDITGAWDTVERLETLEIVDDDGHVKQLSLDLGESLAAQPASA
jgi:Zn-dependent peptidase ImmA (M78 family)/transcriptional regulator with XRE-family HTH domain